MASQIVIGAGPDALRAAAVRASTGAPVLLLQQGPSPSGLVHPDLPQSTGRMRTREADRDLTERVFGPLVEAPDPGQGLLSRKKVHFLPLRRRQVPTLLEPSQRAAAALGWLRARRTLASQELVAGGGQEERSYRDWVVRRMGSPAFTQLYADYAERRFGAAADRLSVTVARVFHGLPDPGPHQVPGGREHVALQEAETRVLEAGGEIRCGVGIEELVVDKGRVVAVRTTDGARVEAEGPVWVARPPALVASWIRGEAGVELRAEAAGLATADLLVLRLKGEVDGLPEVLHVLDRGAPFWQVISPYGIKEYALFFTTLAPGDAAPELAAHAENVAREAQALGLGSFELEGACMERVREHLPVWTHGCHAHFHRVVDQYQALGLVAVGRTGTFSFLDPGEEVSLAAACLGPAPLDQREILRGLVDPPARLDDLSASIRRFIER